MLKSPTVATALPTVKVSARGVSRLKSGHVWVYRSDINSDDSIPPGALVGVTDERGKFLGTALYSSASQIALRMLSPQPVTDLPALLRQRIEAAIAYHAQVISDTDKIPLAENNAVGISIAQVISDTDAYRVIFSEGDFIPGLIVDRYNDILSLQVLTQAMDAEPVRQVLIQKLNEE